MRSVWTGTVGGVGGFLRPHPQPPIILGGFGPKMAALAGRVADGINVPGGAGGGQLLDVARSARAAAGRQDSPFVVTVSSDLRARSLQRLEELDVDRVVVFLGRLRRPGCGRWPQPVLTQPARAPARPGRYRQR